MKFSLFLSQFVEFINALIQSLTESNGSRGTEIERILTLEGT
jgi:hypothetical protein